MLYEQGYLTETISEDKEINAYEKSIKIAKNYYEKAAELGHLDALTDLGYMIQTGLKDQNNPNIYIEEPNIEKAIEFYKRAKKKKFPRALNNLGKLYLDYSNDEKVYGDNLRKGIKYLEIASELGSVKALYNLGETINK